MKKIFLVLSVYFLAFSTAEGKEIPNDVLPGKFDENKANTSQTIHYVVNSDPDTFSTTFVLNSDKQLFGTVYKSAFHLTTHYDLYDSMGQYIATGRSLLLCFWGKLYTWGMEFEVTDAKGNYIGWIDGQYVTTAPAKFSIFDKDAKRIGIAYLDQTCDTFSIMDPNNNDRLIARISRVFVLNAEDYWNVHVYDPKAIPEEIIKVFAAFACDTQGSFRADR